MNREELLKCAKPILFNTDMVRAILDGRKTVTRRVMKPQPMFYTGRKYVFADDVCPKKWEDCPNIIDTYQYQPGYILYVRETWGICNLNDDENIAYIVYKASENEEYEGCREVRFQNDKFEKMYDSMAENSPDWHPSIHIPKEAARIFLKVTNVRVERLQCMSWDDICNEGITPDSNIRDRFSFEMLCNKFKNIWDSTIKKSDINRYGWYANPFVWVIEFERLEV